MIECLVRRIKNRDLVCSGDAIVRRIGEATCQVFFINTVSDNGLHCYAGPVVKFDPLLYYEETIGFLCKRHKTNKSVLIAWDDEKALHIQRSMRVLRAFKTMYNRTTPDATVIYVITDGLELIEAKVSARYYDAVQTLITTYSACDYCRTWFTDKAYAEEVFTALRKVLNEGSIV